MTELSEKRGKPKISTAIRVRDFLQESGPCHRYFIWQQLHVQRKLTRMRFNSFTSYFRTLERLGLVVRVRPPTQSTEKAKQPTSKYKMILTSVRKPKLFRANARKLDSPDWNSPQRALYPNIFRPTGRRRGRPEGSKNKPKVRQEKGNSYDE